MLLAKAKRLQENYKKDGFHYYKIAHNTVAIFNNSNIIPESIIPIIEQLHHQYSNKPLIQISLLEKLNINTHVQYPLVLLRSEQEFAKRVALTDVTGDRLAQPRGHRSAQLELDDGLLHLEHGLGAEHGVDQTRVAAAE